MKALMLVDRNRFEYVDVPRPTLHGGEVLIEVRACGICGSDVHGMDGGTGRRRWPLIMGHEAAGVIAELAPGVSGWNVGDRVTFDSTLYCGRCRFCRRGQVNLCDDRRVLGVACEDYRRDGAFAQYVAVPQRILYRLDDSLPFERAAMAESLSIAMHAANRTPLGADDTVAVVGTGMIGLLIVQMLRARPCGQIIAVDMDARRLELAVRFGAHEAIQAGATDVPAAVRHATDGRGADAVLEVVGAGATVALAVECARKGGHVTLVGNISPMVELPLQHVVTRELTIAGSCASCGEYPACLEMLAGGRLDVDPLISAVAPLEEGPEWFRRLHDGQDGLLKVILRPPRDV